MMKLKTLISTVMLTVAMGAMAQTADDPIIMKINGVPVTRSEFEYSYNKNNSEGVIDKKTVKEYVDLFENYKLKVLAAEDEHLDTLTSFNQEFATYRDQQIRPAMITDADVEKKAQEIYKETEHRVDSTGGLVKPAHILVLLRQGADKSKEAAAKARIDSIYNVLQAANFDETVFSNLAKELSDDKGSARDGGVLPFIQKGQTLPAFDAKVFSMQKGETCAPIQTEAGFHIIQLRDKGTFSEMMPYDSLRTNIINFIDQRGIRNQIINARLDEIAKETGSTPEQVLADKRKEMESEDPDLKYLIQEYHDGLLLYEISSRTVWDKGAKDEAGLEKYFKKNKKKYTWDEPRFKGMAYRTRDVADVDAVKKCVKKLDFDKWNEKLRSTFNNDSILRIRVEKGVFKKGDNAIVDKYEFGISDKEIKPLKDYPNVATYGKLLKKPESYTDVKGLVVADYQEELEKAWVEELRNKYPVEVYWDVVDTVNKH